MKQTILLLVSLMSYLGVFCQTVAPEAIGSAGGHFETSEVQMSWTLGEIVTETIQSESVILTQGFHQSNLIITALEDLAENIIISISPNPTTDFVTITIEEPSEDMELKLSNVTGQTLMTKPHLPKDSSTQFDLSNYMSGTYFLQLVDTKQQAIKTFKIIKTN